LKEKLDNIALLFQKEKSKWLRVHLGHLIITNSIQQDFECHGVQGFVKEFLEFFGNMDDVRVKYDWFHLYLVDDTAGGLGINWLRLASTL
jgi:hypothetical protein